jgi:hypothetical protein
MRACFRGILQMGGQSIDYMADYMAGGQSIIKRPYQATVSINQKWAVS